MRSSRLLDLDVTGYAPIYSPTTLLPVEDTRPHYSTSAGHDWDAHYAAISKPLAPSGPAPESFDISARAKTPDAWIDLRARQLVAQAKFDFHTGADYPFAYELEELREAEELQSLLEPVPNFDELRSYAAGRELLAHWKARATWRELHAQPQDEVDGFAPQDDEVTELEKRLTMEDEAFRYGSGGDWAMSAEKELIVTQADSQSRFTYCNGYAVIDHDAPVDDEVEVTEVEGDCWTRWESEDRYIDGLTKAKRAELISLLRERGVDPTQRAVLVFVEKRMRAKGHNRLRAYASCCYMIRRGFFTGFAYDGWQR
jgi:hypothetical protein